MRTTLFLTSLLLTALFPACGSPQAPPEQVGSGLVFLSRDCINTSLSPDDIYPKLVGQIVLTARRRVTVYVEPVDESDPFVDLENANPVDRSEETGNPDDTGLLGDIVAVGQDEQLTIDVTVTEYFEGAAMRPLILTGVLGGVSTRELRDIKVTNSPPEPLADLTSRRIPVSLTKPEGVSMLPSGFAKAFAAAGHPVAVVAGEEGASLVDLKDGIEIRTVDLGAQWLVVAAWDAATGVGALLGAGPGGLAISHYDADADAFEAAVLHAVGENCTDVSPVGADGNTKQVLFVNNASNYVGQLGFNEATQRYELDPERIPASAFPDGFGGLISAHRGEPDGPVLVISASADDGFLWQHAGPGEGGAAAQVSFRAVGAGRIRICGDWAVASGFGPGTGLGFGGMTYAERNAQGDFEFAYGLSVPEGALGLGCIVLPSGNVGVVTPFVSSGRYRLSEIDVTTGNLVSDVMFDTPEGYDAPGSAAWVQANAIVISYNDEYALELIVLDG